jgi:molecular chaperone GrpE
MTRNKTNAAIEPEYLDVGHELTGAEDTAGQGPAQNSPGGAPEDARESATELEKTSSERNALLDRMARTQAEFENTRKRMERERQEFKNFALEDALKSLLPILDSFDRALQSPAPNPEEFRRGVVLIRQQLDDALKKLGLREIPAKGEPFDPHLHEAVEVVESPAADDNHVLEELQRGYKLRDRLLRPARVLVARNQRR